MDWDIWTRQPPWAWPLAAMEFWRQALDVGADDAAGAQAPIAWNAPASLALEFDALRLWDFSVANSGTPVVIVAPFALHNGQIVDLAPRHSLVEVLLAHGCRRIYLVEWKSATAQTQANGVDALLAALNVAVDDIGAPVDFIGLCQGGWFALVYAARFPRKARRLVAVGAPVDVRACASPLTQRLEQTSDDEIRRFVAQGGGRVRGAQLAALWPRETDSQARLAEALQLSPPFDTPETQAVIAAFEQWDRRVVDLPGRYYCEAVGYLYRENLLARGAFPALGKTVDLRELRRPLYLLVGDEDPIAPPAQALAAAALIGGETQIAHAPCGHLALFIGRRTLIDEWPRVAHWLNKDDAPA